MLGGGFAAVQVPAEGSGWGCSPAASRWAAGFVQVQLFLNHSGQNGLAAMCLLFVYLLILVS